MFLAREFELVLARGELLSPIQFESSGKASAKLLCLRAIAETKV